jgi:hypothetical protein
MAGREENAIPAREIISPTISGFEHPAALSKGAHIKILIGDSQ